MLRSAGPRVVLYGRHSSAMQTASSSTDQTASCIKLVNYVGGAVVATYHDPEQSGYRRDRLGLKSLLADIEAGTVDMVVCEALDRLARDAEDVAWLGKKLAYHRVQLHTVSEGHVDEIKFAVAGLLGAIFLKHLIDKTLRGMEAAVLAGRFAGGRSYGYKRVIRLDDRGEHIRGLLEIDEAKAAIVERIFTEFAADASSIQIATRLNADGVPGPRGGQWNASTIRGDPKRRPASSTTRSMLASWYGDAGSGVATPIARSASDVIAYVRMPNGSRSPCRICVSSTTRSGAPFRHK